ncbi:MAG TPA: cytochrome C [Deltaproteobacteria bacterium]|nr:cytochrome C [Deltaproteobacteria bacterium]
MSQTFRPSANFFFKLVVLGIGAGVLSVGLLFYLDARSDYVTGVNVAPEQPIPFSHKHHVQGLGLDCRYCHTSVEISPFAGMPSTHTCMTCHSQLFSDSQALKALRDSSEKNLPISWTRVQRLADFAYFDHSIHVQKGVGCSTCHGQVQAMPLVWEHKRFLMQECLECHRQPQKYLRPPEEIFNMSWKKTADNAAERKNLVEHYRIHTNLLTNCSTCHR